MNKLVLSLIVFLLIIGVVANYYSIGVNETKSLPHSIFVINKTKTPNQTEQYLAFNYTSKSGKKHIFIKKVAGLAGDEVSVDSNRVFKINNKYNLKAKEISLGGDKLELGQTGIIPLDSYFVYSPHEDSYDSRYKGIGMVKPEDVVGIAYPLF